MFVNSFLNICSVPPARPMGERVAARFGGKVAGSRMLQPTRVSFDPMCFKGEGELEWDHHISIDTETKCGYRMFSRFGFLTQGEFLSEFKVEAKSITGVKIVQRMDQFGTRLLSGVAFKLTAGDELKYRIYEDFFEITHDKHKQVLRLQGRLRQKEPDEVFSGLCKTTASEHPAVPL